MRVSREDAIALCNAAGYLNAGKWKRQRIVRKLAEMAVVAKEGGLEVEDDERLDDLLKAVADADEIEVVDVADVVDTEDGQDADDAGGSGVDEDLSEAYNEEPDVDDPDDEDDPETGEDEKPEANVEEDKTAEETESKLEPEKKAKITKKPTKAKSKRVKSARKTSTMKRKEGPSIDGKPEHIKSICNRLFYAGQLLKQRGLEEGLSDDLIAEVDRLCGKPNQAASRTQLGYAWHVVNGYLNG